MRETGKEKGCSGGPEHLPLEDIDRKRKMKWFPPLAGLLACRPGRVWRAGQ